MPLPVRAQGSPTCGIDSLFIAATLEAKTVVYKELYTTEYVSSVRGSSITDLERAANRIGFFPLTLVRLSIADLSHARSPLILHVRSSAAVTDYDHYVVYTGTEGDRVRIVDPGEGVKEISKSQLAAMWSRRAIVLVKDDPILRRSPWDGRLTGFTRVAMAAAVSSIAAVGYSMVRHRGARARFALALPLTGALWGLGFHQTNEAGLLVDPAGYRQIEEFHTTFAVAKVSPGQLIKMLGRGEAIAVDTRSVKQYLEGHVQGAVLVSYNDVIQNKNLSPLAGLPKDKPLVLYCEHAQCHVSDRVAMRMKQLGFENVQLMPQGWEAYKAAGGPQSVGQLP